MIFVHLKREDLGGQGTLAGELHDGAPIAADTLRRLACDCALVTATTDDRGHPLHLGRRTRRVSAALLRALQLRDRHCRFPGCTCRAFLDAHHLEHWLHGGETSIDNLILLCPHHHTLLHEGGFQASLEQGEPTFCDPGGRAIAFVQAEPTTIAAVPPRANLIAWDGRPQDMAGAAQALVRRAAVRPSAVAPLGVGASR